MGSKKKLLSAAVATAGLTMLATAAPAAAQEDYEPMTKRYDITNGALNGSGASAEGQVWLTNTTVRAQFQVDGVSPDAFHAQHFHGDLGERNVCPTPAADTDGDGRISTPEGVPAYGGIQASLTTTGDTSATSALAADRFPVSSSGSYSYDRTFELPPEVAWYLGSLHLVTHGMDFNDSGSYDGPDSPLDPSVPFEATIPNSCGMLTLVDVDLPAVYDGATGARGTVARMYALMLNRAPEAAGFQFWVDLIEDQGVSPYALAIAFRDSPEFQQRFGDRLANATDAEWVDFVYRASFGRVADDAGRQYWIAELGSPRLDRPGMLVAFAQSQEYMRLTSTS